AAAKRLRSMANGVERVEDAVHVVAQELLEGIECPPTDLEAVGERVNVRSFVAEDLPISGQLRRGANGFTIAYSVHLSQSRKRFTIAHEIGHAILEGTGPGSPRFGSELERICDMLATELLMPRKIFAGALCDGVS